MTTHYLRTAGVRGRLLALGLFTPICHVHAANGTWNVNAPGNWSDPANWTGGIVASGTGAIADFSTLNITGDHAVNIDAPFTIGTLVAQDLTTASNFWVFSGTGPLTLDNGASQPVLNVLNRPHVLSAPLAGTNGLSKTGAGLITLSGDNSALSGVLNLQNVTGTNSSGLVLSGTPSIGGITTINVLGTPTTGPYLGLNGNIVLGSGITLNLTSQGGNAGPPGAIRSEGGVTTTNVINGPININGAGVRIGNNASKLLQLNGAITGGTNGVTFRTSVNDGIHVTNPANSWTGSTIHSEGILWFHPGTLPPTSPLIIGASAGGTVHLSGTMNRALGTGVGEVRLGSAEATVNARPLGLSARGGDLAVNFGGASAEVFFNNFTTSTTGTPSTINTNILVLNGVQADGKLTLANPINLNGANRTLQVDANTVEPTGGLKGDAFTYTKTGAGTLLLSNANNTWLGDLTIGSAGDSVNAGIVRVTHSEALGATGTVKNINAMGLNRGISLVELSGGVTIDSAKTLKMWGKAFAANNAASRGLPQSLRSVSGNNAWNGSVLVSVVGGAYGVEALADTLTIGDSPSTTSVIRNDVANSSRTVSLFGPGNFVINNQIVDNDAMNVGIVKVGSGNLTISRTDNTFDLAPNLFAGTTQISSLADTTLPSSLGAAGSFNLGATLRYTGAGGSSNRTLSLLATGGTLDASGSDALALTGTAFNHNGGITATTAAPFGAGATELVLNEAAGIAIGQSITGTNIPANTTVTAVNVDTRTVTLSQATSAASAVSLTMTIGGAGNIPRTLTLTGSNTGTNSLAAPLSNASALGTLGVTKTGPGKWVLNGTNYPYSGPTLVSQGTLGFNGAFPVNSQLTVPVGSTLSLANLSLPVREDTGRALDIDGTLAIDGPVTIVLPDAAPTGSLTVLEYGSITGAANLVSNYRGTGIAAGASSASLTVGTAVPLTWTGAFDNFWDTKLTSNWKNAANAQQMFFWADPVRFDDGGELAPGVVLSGELRPASMTIDADLVEYFFDGTGGFLSGPFPLTKSGSATAQLGGANTFTGSVTVNEGILRPLGNQALGAAGKEIKVNSGGQLDVNGAMNANRDYQAKIAGTGPDGSGALVNTLGGVNNGFGSLTLTANATIGGTGRFDVRPITAGSATVDLAGFTLTKTGMNLVGLIDGTLLDGGNINIDQGTLALTRMVATGSGVVNVNPGGTLQFENYTTGAFGRNFNVNDATVRLIGTASLAVASNVQLTGTSTFDVDATRTLTVDGAVTGTGNLVKSAPLAGTLTLTGTNTYAGTTTINAGTLLVNGNQSTANGAVSVASGATLGGTGTVGGSITAATGSTIAPGVAIGTLTTTAPVTLSGALVIELDGSSSDRLTVGGALDITGSALTLTTLAEPAQAAYVIASYSGLTGTFSGVTGLPTGYTLNYDYNGLKQIALVRDGDAYTAFEAANGITGAGSTADSDGDGIVNGIEFVIGGDPSGPDSNSNALKPTVTTDATYLTFVFRRTDDSASFNPVVQYGSDLSGWTNAQHGTNGVIITVENNFYNGSTDRVTVQIPRALADPSKKLFARLNVIIP
jgi:fibronectin-binding autotransporter adhesin